MSTKSTNSNCDSNSKSNEASTPSKSSSDDLEEVELELDYEGRFDVHRLNQHLKLCIQRQQVGEDEDVVDNQNNMGGNIEILMDEYIQIFHQLYKFFNLLGKVFSFVGSDVKAKVEILQTFRNGSNKTNYESVEKMLKYEKDSGYLKDNKHGNGSRTFLRLHRALIFVSMFLNKSIELRDEEGTAHICKQAYTDSLAKFHPWLVQKGAILAMYTLPNKKDLFKSVSGDKVYPDEEINCMVSEAVKFTQEIYDQCEKLYAQYELSELP